MNLLLSISRSLRAIFAIAFVCCMAQAYALQSKLHPTAATQEMNVVVTEDHSTDFDFNNVTVVGVVAFLISLGSLFYTYQSYRSQRSTEANTMNVPIEHQRNKFKDLSRHTYRNLVCTLSAAIKFFDTANGEERQRLTYPSESNMLKLEVQPEDVVMEINPSLAASVSELRLLLRNYNIEIEVATQHLSRQTISDSALNQDFDNLLFKPLYLVKRTYSLENDLVALTNKKSTNINNELLHRTMSTIVQEHFSKVCSGLRQFMDRGEMRHIGLLDASGEACFLGVDHTAALRRAIDFLFKGSYTFDALPVLHFTMKNNADPAPAHAITCLLGKDDYNRLLDNTAGVIELIDKAKEDNPEVFKHLATYRAMASRFLSSKEISFADFFLVALRLDAIIELPKIGMVNFD